MTSGAADIPARTPARLTRLGLQNFRNHAATVMRMDGRHVCLFGANGAGKTNLLEAVSMLAPGRGMRSADQSDIVRRTPDGADPGGWALSADLMDDGLVRKLSVSAEVSGGRSARSVSIDGASVTQSELGEILRIVWLTPAQDRVFAGAAGERRKFFDRQVLAHSPTHGSASTQYEKAMRNRNALLEQGGRDPYWLDALEAQMAEAGAVIAVHRAQALAAMKAAIDERPEGAFPKADLEIDGKYEALAAASADLVSLAAEIREDLRSGRGRDFGAGRTLSGVHRSDLKVFHRPKSLPADQCSTGEQKALLMGLILANAQALFRRDFAPNPLLLLDEAVAHLDSDRRAALYDELAALGGQAWLTGTDRSLFDAFGDRAEFFEVSEGAVRPV